MLLRPRQKLFIERSVRALDEHRNTLGVAPTGAGKTIMLSAATGDVIGNTAAKACVLAHRDELTTQNRTKFGRVNPKRIMPLPTATGASSTGRCSAIRPA